MPPGYVLQWLPLELMGVVAAVAAGAWLWRAALGPLAKRLRAGLRRIETFLDDWDGDPGRPGVDPRPGMPERVHILEQLVPGLTLGMKGFEDKLNFIEYHVQPNGGESAHDALTKQLTAIAEDVKGLTQAQTIVAGLVDDLLRRIGRVEAHTHTSDEES